MSDRRDGLERVAVGGALVGAGEATRQLTRRDVKHVKHEGKKIFVPGVLKDLSVQGANRKRIAGGWLAGRSMMAAGVPLMVTGTTKATSNRKGRRDHIDIKEEIAEPVLSSIGVPDALMKMDDEDKANLGHFAAAGLAGGLGKTVMSSRGHRLTGQTAGFVGGSLGGVVAFHPVRRRILDEERRRKKISKSLTRNEKKEYDEVARRKGHLRALQYTAATTGLSAVAMGLAPRVIRATARKHKGAEKLLPKADEIAHHSGHVTTGSVGVGGLTTIYAANTSNREQKVNDKILVDKADVVMKGFAEKYDEHLSPSAKERYRYMKRRRNVDAGHFTIDTAATAGLLHRARRGGTSALVAVGAAPVTGLLGVNAARNAYGYEKSLDGIRRKAIQRKRDGVTVDQNTGRERAVNLSKAMFRIPKPRTRPVGFGGVRRGGLVRRGPRVYSRMGSLG